ncbi:hypothetical protein Pst134EA_026639 [Puccinia striiformis f. sp. tritici]|uniref:hypothetical protein n=1 Tax=Puccinia striiformis f. sp. tritici TaxID=168172 RepID=UPI00200896E8|nr:hypothetical protein Pst134EA_026639 [Puccinia striiformis f. sp. tritici]KAH9449928.1 hypothetical protein Pst134EA_026639 [Puccinia striiformis f. sp. tritici]
MASASVSTSRPLAGLYQDPNLIGEGKVDLTETLKKGEFDGLGYNGSQTKETPPEKIHTPTGPSRAGVFEASSPGSGLRPTQALRQVARENEKKSPVASVLPVKKINPATVPVALRAGRHRCPDQSPLAICHYLSEPSSSKDASLQFTAALLLGSPHFSQVILISNLAITPNTHTPLVPLYTPPDQHEDHFHDHVNPSFVDPSYHDHLPQSSQPPGSQKTAFPILCVSLPVPLRDSVHRPTSLGVVILTTSPSEVHLTLNERNCFFSATTCQLWSNTLTILQMAFPVMYNNGTAYPPPNLHNEGLTPKMESINRAWLIGLSTLPYFRPT